MDEKDLDLLIISMSFMSKVDRWNLSDAEIRQMEAIQHRLEDAMIQLKNHERVSIEFRKRLSGVELGV